jgi:hypothetical protein
LKLVLALGAAVLTAAAVALAAAHSVRAPSGQAVSGWGLSGQTVFGQAPSGQAQSAQGAPAPAPSASAPSGPVSPAPGPSGQVSPTPRTASGPAWLTEITQLAALPAPYQQDVARRALVLANVPPLTSSAEHYTRIAACPATTFHYATKCLSLTTDPPRPGTYALYDLEGWQLTGTWEQQNQCRAMFQAAAMIRADGAVPVIAPLSPSVEGLVRCAARAAGPGGMVHLQAQPHESDLRTYMRKLKNAATWARQEVPGIAVSFGLSTNPKYHATPAIMFAAWRAATSYLGPSTPCWLNITPFTAESVKKATAFLRLVYQ